MRVVLFSWYCCEKWVGLNPSGKGPTAAPPSGNGSTGSALGGAQQEVIKVRNSRHEISLSLVRISTVAQKGHCYFSTIVCICPAYYNFLKKHFDFFLLFRPGWKVFPPGWKVFQPGWKVSRDFPPGWKHFPHFPPGLHPHPHPPPPPRRGLRLV